MNRTHWLSRLLSGSRGSVVAALRRGPATVAELGTSTGLSANAIRNHLGSLERDALIAAEPDPAGAVGKPPLRYRLTERASSLTPKAYDAMLDLVLSAARARVGPQRYGQILDDVAARIAGDATPPASFDARLADARALLASLGAAVEVERRGGRLRLSGRDCPLASVVGRHPELCALLADVLGQRLGVPVTHCCDRSGALPRCCFEAALPRGA